jgi:outer membrane immunogenic protein
MRKILLLTVSLASLGLVLPAQAADVVVPEEAFSWTGVHIGAGGGVGYNTYDVDSLFAKDSVFGFEALSLKADDLSKWYGFGTIELGADYQFPNSPLLIGFLASYDLNGDTSANADSFSGTDNGDFTQSSAKAELDDSLFVGGRLGIVLNDTTLLYGLGGYTWVDGKVKASNGFDRSTFFEAVPIDFFGGSSIDKKESVDGWTIGGGIEQMLTDTFSIKLEYRHDFLDDIKWNETDFFDGISATQTSGKVDFSRDTVRAVISVHFNP